MFSLADSNIYYLSFFMNTGPVLQAAGLGHLDIERAQQLQPHSLSSAPVPGSESAGSGLVNSQSFNTLEDATSNRERWLSIFNFLVAYLWTTLIYKTLFGSRVFPLWYHCSIHALLRIWIKFKPIYCKIQELKMFVCSYKDYKKFGHNFSPL